MDRSFSVFFLLVVLSSFGQAALFDGVWRSYGKALNGAAIPLPLTTNSALDQGWQAEGRACVAGMGYQYFDGATQPRRFTPLSIWFDAKGNISGLSMYLFGGGAPAPLIGNYWRKSPYTSNSYYLSVGFRSSLVCDSTSPDSNGVGNIVVLNPDLPSRVNYSLNEQDTYCAGYTQGSAMKCFGTHYFKHLDHSDMYNSSKLEPVGVMYWNGQLTTFMIMSPSTQTAVTSVWDGTPLTNGLMCQNWCDDSCNWDVPFWSTLHVFLTSDYVSILPPNNEGPPVYRNCVDNAVYSC